MKIKNCILNFCVLSVAVLLTGMGSCEEFISDPEKAMMNDKTPRYVITIHEKIKYKRMDLIEQDVDSFFGGTICVNRNPLIHSRDIKKIELSPRPGNKEFFDLKLTLSDRGQKMWSALAVGRAEKKKYGILIDGMYYRDFIPEILIEPTAEEYMKEKVVVTIEGPFDPATAKGLQINSERNYKIFTP